MRTIRLSLANCPGLICGIITIFMTHGVIGDNATQGSPKLVAHWPVK